MADPIRVLHVFGVMNRGGAEMRTVELMRRLDRTAFQLEFCTLSGQTGSLDEEIFALGGAVHSCPLRASFLPRFAALLRRRRIEVVHSHVHLSSGLMLAVAMAMGVTRRVAHFRSTADEHGQSAGRRGYRRVMRALIDRAATDIVGCGAGALAHGWSNSWRRDPRCAVILNGIDPSRFDNLGDGDEIRRQLGIPGDARLAVHVGRFDFVKNQVRTAAIFAAATRHSPLHLAFVGRGGTAEEAATRSRVQALGVGDRVHFLGERVDVPRILNAADALVLNSHNEGMPGVVLEALAAGTPVVANDLPGVLEISDHLPGITILPIGESDERWGATLASVVGERRSAAARNAARSAFRASPFSLEVSLAGHEALWRRARS